MENINKDLMQFTFSCGEILSNYRNEFNFIKEKHETHGINIDDGRELKIILSKLCAIYEIMVPFQIYLVRPDDERIFEFYPADEFMDLISDIENFMSVGFDK